MGLIPPGLNSSRNICSITPIGELAEDLGGWVQRENSHLHWQTKSSSTVLESFLYTSHKALTQPSPTTHLQTRKAFCSFLQRRTEARYFYLSLSLPLPPDKIAIDYSLTKLKLQDT